MDRIPLHRFGTRWHALKEGPPPTGGGVPDLLDQADETQEGRISKQNDPVSNKLFTSVLVVFTLLLSYLVEGFRKTGEVSLLYYILNNPENFSIVCFLCVVLIYSWYIAVYFRTIWNRYYSLYEKGNNDENNFVLYAFLMSIISILGLVFIPEYWPFYIVLLFVLLAFRKNNTKKHFRQAVDDFLDESNVSNNVDALIETEEANDQPLWVRQLISARVLSISFTFNFIVWGIFVFGSISMIMIFASLGVLDFGVHDYIYSHQIASGSIVALMVVFYIFKIAGGVNRIQRQIENGEWQGFGMWRKPWS